MRRVRDRNHHDALFPVWRYHPFFTNNTEPTAQADITHRGHAVIETVFLRPHRRSAGTHLPSGHFAANSAWALCAAIAHNLLRAAATLSGRASARGATLRRQLVNVPAHLVKPQRRPVLTAALALAPRPTMAAPVEQHLPRDTPPPAIA